MQQRFFQLSGASLRFSTHQLVDFFFSIYNVQILHRNRMQFIYLKSPTSKVNIVASQSARVMLCEQCLRRRRCSGELSPLSLCLLAYCGRNPKPLISNSAEATSHVVVSLSQKPVTYDQDHQPCSRTFSFKTTKAGNGRIAAVAAAETLY